jgi:hypothetical protein
MELLLLFHAIRRMDCRMDLHKFMYLSISFLDSYAVLNTPGAVEKLGRSMVLLPI